MQRSRFLWLLLFALLHFPSLLFAQRLQDSQQSTLDGRYAGLRQKRIDALRLAVSQGTMTADQADREIQELTQYVNNLRNRWKSTRYARQFENGFRMEMQTRATTPRPYYQPPAPPFRIPLLFKLAIAGAGFWICRKLWTARVGYLSAPPAVDPSKLTVELNSAENAKIAEAQAHFDSREKELTDLIGQWQRHAQKLAVDAATLGAQAGALAKQIESQAVAILNETVPEYNSFRTEAEKNRPLALASWSDTAVWSEFARNPKAQTLHHVRFGQMEEIDKLPGETGIISPRTAALFYAKGPLIIKSDAANRARTRAIVQNIVLRAALAAPAETRFSLIDPLGLGAGFPMRGLLPKVRTSARTPADELAEVVDDIRRINETVVGQAESFESLAPEKRAGEVFEIVVALDYPKAYERDPRALEYLARIASSGPRAGRHLVLEWEGPPSAADLAKFEKHELINGTATGSHLAFDAVPPADFQKSLLQAVSAVKAKSNSADWNAQIRPQEGLMRETSERMVATPVGERLRIWFGDNADGKPCAHAMLAGQTGSGKSFLLHVLITGLAARYSPQELRLVLVDGKQGVEFEAYKALPHAKVVCLRTSPAVARSVLDDFVAEMEDRYVEFQRHGVNKLEDYRRKTGAQMPRMLMIVDEYQQLLDGDPDRGAQMLSRVLEKGRAAGTHLVLGSQTFEVRGLPASAMTHVHLRAALSLPIDYIQALNAFGGEGKRLIRDLAPSGQAVINDESGRDGANSRGAVARLDASSGCGLQQVVAGIQQEAAARLPGGAGPVVLSGNDAAVLADNAFVRKWRSNPPDAATLQEVARLSLRDGGFGIASWSAADRPLALWLGRKFDVHGHLLAPLRRAPGHNLLALGSETQVRLCMLANALSGLRAMLPLAGSEVLLLDGLSAGQPGAGMLAVGAAVLRASGANVRIAGPSDAVEALDQFTAPVLQGQSGLSSPNAVRLLILSEPEYFAALAAPAGFGPPPAGPSRNFKEYLRNGPPLGAHAIVTASGIGSLTTVLHPSRDAALFQHRVVQQTNEEESMTLFSSLAATRIAAQTDHHMAGMYVDTVQGVRAAQLFKAYAANANLYGDQSPVALTASIRELFGGRRPEA